jgi:hypothetical protein
MASPSSSEPRKSQRKRKHYPKIAADDLYDPNSRTPRPIRPSAYPSPIKSTSHLSASPFHNSLNPTTPKVSGILNPNAPAHHPRSVGSMERPATATYSRGIIHLTPPPHGALSAGNTPMYFPLAAQTVSPIISPAPAMTGLENQMLKESVDTPAKAHSFCLSLMRDIAGASITNEEMEAHLKNQVHRKV